MIRMSGNQKRELMADDIRTRPTLLSELGSDSNEQAWLRFYEVYKGAIMGLARRWGLSEAASWDVLQEVMLAVSRVSHSFTYDRDQRVFIANPGRTPADPSKTRGGFRQWLFVVVKRAIWKHRFNPRKEREVLFSDLSSGEDDGAQRWEKTASDAPLPDAVMDEKSERDYLMSLFEQAIRLLPACTKRSHPRKLAIFLALKQPHVFQSIIDANSGELPATHIAEVRALSRLKRDPSGQILKQSIMEHYAISSNHLDQEVKAIKDRLVAIFADLRSGRDPR